MFSAIGRADKFNNENGREREEKKKRLLIPLSQILNADSGVFGKIQSKNYYMSIQPLQL